MIFFLHKSSFCYNLIKYQGIFKSNSCETVAKRCSAAVFAMTCTELSRPLAGYFRDTI